ncbi:MAG: metalloregulator ArsR/SmtB family transcription factor [Burkholderiaceae bacterium]|jgi:DNA-binding transcriptional ArsR family regulator
MIYANQEEVFELRVQAARASKEDRLDAILHALSDQTRRALLQRLTSGPGTVGELAKPMRMTRGAVSKHLRVLEQARLISRTVSGRTHWCALAPAPLRELEKWLTEYRRFWVGNLDALARYTEDRTDEGYIQSGD